ncbi:MAG TPA: PAS domain S-box protein, partial [Burkholderiales bacterium]|nr:PAS domain S-box protein [Burkholderiales bacterium]
MLSIRPDYKILPLLCGCALVALGAATIYGWLSQTPVLVQWFPGLIAMVGNTALCFALTGGALVYAHFKPTQHRVPQTIAALVTVFGVLVLGGKLLGFDSVFDLPALHAWLKDSNPRPGRMALNTVVGLAAAGVALWLIHAQENSALRTRFTAGLIAVVFAIGLTGFIGHGLELHLLFEWFENQRLALPTAAGMSLLGLGLWGAYLRAAVSRRVAPISPDRRINLIGSLTLIIVALATGLAGFLMLQERTRAEIARGLSQGLANHLAGFDNAVEQRRKTTYVLSQDPRMVAIAKQVGNRDDARESFRALLALPLADNLRAATLRRADGSATIEIGSPFDTETLTAELDGDIPAFLIWEKQYLLKTQQPVYDARGRLVAYLEIIEAAPELDRIFLPRTGFGATGELRVCVLREEQARCFPGSQQPQLYSTEARQAEAMYRAMNGERGEYSGPDFRGNSVIAAYAPLPGTGLGIALKQDATEIYKPIGDRLKFAFPVLLLLAAAGAILLRLQVRPLTKRLVLSEQKAHRAMLMAAASDERTQAVLSNIGDGILISDGTGRIESANGAAYAIFGYTDKELVGRNLDILLIDPSIEHNDRALSNYIAGDSHKIVDQGPVFREGLHKSGKRIPLEISVSHVCHGEEVRFVGIMRDISARLAAEVALHAEKERLHVTLQSIGDAVITTDTQARITYLNPAAEKMTGWCNGEAVGRSTSEVFRIV